MAKLTLTELRLLAEKEHLNDRKLQDFLDNGVSLGGDKRESVMPYSGISTH